MKQPRGISEQPNSRTYDGEPNIPSTGMENNLPVRHHLETFGTDRVHNLASLFGISYLELLLQEYRRLLVG